MRKCYNYNSRATIWPMGHNSVLFYRIMPLCCVKAFPQVTHMIFRGTIFVSPALAECGTLRDHFSVWSGICLFLSLCPSHLFRNTGDYFNLSYYRWRLHIWHAYVSHETAHFWVLTCQGQCQSCPFSNFPVCPPACLYACLSTVWLLVETLSMHWNALKFRVIA